MCQCISITFDCLRAVPGEREKSHRLLQTSRLPNSVVRKQLYVH